jgi:plasmid maintenance system killer protein
MDELGLTEDELNAEHYDHLIWLCQAIQDNPNHQVLTYTPPTGINNLERLKIHTAGWYSMEKLFSA